jgi:CRP/FNR family transcriptional regulator, cyclic AMP receptor protein
VSEESLHELAQESDKLSFAVGDIIVEEGTLGNLMFVIGQGRVQVVKYRLKPDEIILATLTARDFFGEMCIIESVSRSASVRAIEPTEVYAFSGGDLYRLFKHRPDDYAIVILNIARDLSRRLRAIDTAFAARAH